MITLTPHQQEALNRIKEFLDDPSAKVFILKGYAGTGKTTLISHIVREIRKRNKNIKLAATTGRAVKVLSDKLLHDKDEHIIYYFDTLDGGLIAMQQLGYYLVRLTTVHGHVYKLEVLDVNEKVVKQLTIFDQAVASKEIEDDSSYKLRFTTVRDNSEGVMIVDEASMIAEVSTGESHARFGSGNLLQDLFASHLQYKFIFIGDPAQLPPVGQGFSPALSSKHLIENYNVKTYEHTLTQIVRIQDKYHGILLASHYLRYQAENPQAARSQQIYLRDISEIIIAELYNLLDNYAINLYREWKKDGKEGLRRALLENIFIVRSNRQVHLWNNKIRQTLFGSNVGKLAAGDILLVTQNNILHKLFNGDLVQVMKLSPFHETVAGLTFQSVKVRRLSDNSERDLYIITDILNSEKSNISPEQHKKLMRDFIIRMAKKNIKVNTTPFLEAISKDPYLNALRAIHGYVVTCHKAQGGEWNNVYINIDPGMFKGRMNRPYNWLYTALTRAKQKAFVSDGEYLKSFMSVLPFVLDKLQNDNNQT